MEIVVPREHGQPTTRRDEPVGASRGGGFSGAGHGLQRAGDAPCFGAEADVGLQAREVVRQGHGAQSELRRVERLFELKRQGDAGRHGIVIEGRRLLPGRGIEDDVLMPRFRVPPVPEAARVSQPMRFDAGVLHQARKVAFKQRRGGGVVGLRSMDRLGVGRYRLARAGRSRRARALQSAGAGGTRKEGCGYTERISPCALGMRGCDCSTSTARHATVTATPWSAMWFSRPDAR